MLVPVIYLAVAPKNFSAKSSNARGSKLPVHTNGKPHAPEEVLPAPSPA